jgi:hypothetical protein
MNEAADKKPTPLDQLTAEITDTEFEKVFRSKTDFLAFMMKLMELLK